MQASGELLQAQAADQGRCASCGSALSDRQCVSCGAALAGPYCAQCGQKAFTGRHTLRRMVSVPLGQLLNLDRGFVHTVLRLTTAPGQVVRDYLAGRTLGFTHPAVYLSISFTAFALLARWTGGMRPAPDPSWTWVLPVLFIAGCSRLLFWRARLNYAEHLMMSFYLVGHVMLFFAVVLVAGYASSWVYSEIVGWGMLSLSASYIAWAYSRFFDRRPLLGAIGGLVVALGVRRSSRPRSGGSCSRS